MPHIVVFCSFLNHFETRHVSYLYDRWVRIKFDVKPRVKWENVSVKCVSELCPEAPYVDAPHEYTNGIYNVYIFWHVLSQL